MYKNIHELQKTLIDLVEIAKKVRKNAQAPYSNFFVGVAVMNTNGDISSGCNVERASYSQTTHAEQNAIDNMIAEYGSQKIKAIAIAAGPKDSEPKGPCWPCGHCRQIIWENCDNDSSVLIITVIDKDMVETSSIGELFPKPFGPNDLGINIFRK